LRRRRWLFVFGVWTLAAVTYAALQYLGAVEASRMSNPPRPLPAWGPFLVWGGAAFYIWAALSPFMVLLARRFPLAGKDWPRNFLLHAPAGVLLMLAHLSAWAALYWNFGGPAAGRFRSFAELFRAQLIGGAGVKVMVYIIVMIVIHALDYYRKYEREERAAAELRTQLAQAQLQALKMQLHPHFLFNTLNAISELIYKDRDAADRMLARLSEMLRLSLEKVGVQEVTLREELEFLGKYLELEQMRFEERLRVEMRVEPRALAACVPNMILQPLVENAVRHAVATRARGGRIEIRAGREDGMLRMEVSDDGEGLSEAAGDGLRHGGGGGVGLSNTRARLECLYGAGHRFELRGEPGAGLTVSVLIPFRDGLGEEEEVGEEEVGEEEEEEG
jgi:two-component system, LytTR family, sensor kinase